MRIIREFFHDDCKISVFQWNGKYLIKLERANLEQTFKIPEYDLPDEASVEKILDKIFMEDSTRRFDDMQVSIRASLTRNS